MLLTESPPTPLDLRFRLFGVDVRVHPLFWLMCALLGWGWTDSRIISNNGMAELGLWILACFVSILLHEFGHVWMGQVFGSHGHILLHSMGGLAIGANATGSSWKRILVCAAGPGIQLLLFAVLMVLIFTKILDMPVRIFGIKPEEGVQLPPALVIFLGMMLQINLFWPLLNLLPIWPLDGGQITREVCTVISPRGVLVSLWISAIVSGVLAVNAFMAMNGQAFLTHYVPTGLYSGIFFALFAVGSWQMIQMEQSRSRYDDDLPWER